MENPRDMLNAFVGGLGEIGQEKEAEVGAFMNLLGTNYQPAAIDTKTKELISVGIACYNRCVYCIVYHCYKALEAGCTREEILDAAMVSVAFGGGPSMAYSVTYLKASLNEFADDFKK
ncbi:MAG: carboxymuconolactone decarboxylase family protein [Clostridia bacterium]